MPHSTTKNTRLKRVDSRPNGKVRKRLDVKAEKSKTIQDIRVTRIGPKREREVQRDVLKKDTVGGENYLKALRKKLKSTEALLLRQSNGESLDEQQLVKISNLDSIVSEMENFAGRSRESNPAEEDAEHGDIAPKIKKRK